MNNNLNNFQNNNNNMNNNLNNFQNMNNNQNNDYIINHNQKHLRDKIIQFYQYNGLIYMNYNDNFIIVFIQLKYTFFLKKSFIIFHNF